jgi:hypothetical protein
MNLHEDIKRIREMMGLIVEDSTLTEPNKETFIDLNTPVNFNKVSSLDDLKTAVKKSGFQHGKETLSRGKGIDLSNLLKSIENLEDKEIYEDYFIKISNLISTYKSGSFSLKKLSEIITQLYNKDPEIAKTQIESVISIFEDPRFAETHKRKLISLLTGSQNVDLDKFFRETTLAYQDYENSLAEGEISPFSIYRTSPRIKVNLIEDLTFNNLTIDSNEFNSQDSDLGKIIYILDKISKSKYYASGDEVISKVISSLKFGFDFNFSPDNVKADLKVKDSLIYEDRGEKKIYTVAKKGENIEVKYNLYNKPSYLSEFFKIDASDKNYNIIIDSLERVPRIKDVTTAFKILMSSLSTNLSNTIKSTNGNQIMEHLTENMAGIIFKNNIFIKKEDINFYWNNVGYANKYRLSLYYEVNDNPTLYKISKTDLGFSRFVQKL